MMLERKDKLDQLERTILELGAEIFRLKTELTDIKSTNSQFHLTLNGLKDILDDKGIIMSEDFEASVEVNSMLSSERENDFITDQEIEKLKKSVH
jgi:regulator of replication initiation timing